MRLWTPLALPSEGTLVFGYLEQEEAGAAEPRIMRQGEL